MLSTSLRSGVSRQDPSAQHPTSGDGLTGIKKKNNPQNQPHNFGQSVSSKDGPCPSSASPRHPLLMPTPELQQCASPTLPAPGIARCVGPPGLSTARGQLRCINPGQDAAVG